MVSKKDDYRIESSSITGGMISNDPKEGEMLRRSLQYFIQRVGNKVLAGDVAFTKMSMPVHLNEPRSALERITDDWAYAPFYLPAAARTSDPIERMKLVAAFVVSGLHCIETLGKPFNPILGSTYQATLGDGTPCYIEQTSHHPPVSHYLVQPESGDYQFTGFSGIDGKIAWGLDTGLSSRRIGINVIKFADGTRIVFNLPRMLLRGLAAEKKCEYLGPFSIFYEEHNLVFDILIDPPQPFRWSPFRARVPSDYMDGVLYRLPTDAKAEDGSIIFTGAFREKEGAYFGNPDASKLAAEQGGYTAIELRSDEEVATSVTTAIKMRDNAVNATECMEREIIAYARGTFVGYLDIDGERIWDIRETPKSVISPRDVKQALGSDCRHREDVLGLKKALAEEEDEETRAALIHEAQTLKEKLENIQRNDRKLRTEGLVTQQIASHAAIESDADVKTSTLEPVTEQQMDGQQDGAHREASKETDSTQSDNQTVHDRSKDRHENSVQFFPESLGGL